MAACLSDMFLCKHGYCWKNGKPLLLSSSLALITSGSNRATLGTVQDQRAALQTVAPAWGLSSGDWVVCVGVI